MSKIHLKQEYFQVMFPFIYRILCDGTFNWGTNSHINGITCDTALGLHNVLQCL